MPSHEAVFWTFLVFVAFCALVLWMLPTWSKHYVEGRKLGWGRAKAAHIALVLTTLPG